MGAGSATKIPKLIARNTLFVSQFVFMCVHDTRYIIAKLLQYKDIKLTFQNLSEEIMFIVFILLYADD